MGSCGNLIYMISLLAIPGFIIFIATFIWIFKKSKHSNKDWELAYLYRIQELKASLPYSPVFPAILVTTTMPGFGNHNPKLYPQILYINKGELFLEYVIYSSKPQKYESKLLFFSPVSSLAIDDTHEFLLPRKLTYLLGKYRVKDGDNYLTSAYTVPKNIFLSKELTDSSRILTNKRTITEKSREELMNALIASGVLNLTK